MRFTIVIPAMIGALAHGISDQCSRLALLNATSRVVPYTLGVDIDFDRWSTEPLTQEAPIAVSMCCYEQEAGENSTEHIQQLKNRLVCDCFARYWMTELSTSLCNLTITYDPVIESDGLPEIKGYFIQVIKWLTTIWPEIRGDLENQLFASGHFSEDDLYEADEQVSPTANDLVQQRDEHPDPVLTSIEVPPEPEPVSIESQPELPCRRYLPQRPEALERWKRAWQALQGQYEEYLDEGIALDYASMATRLADNRIWLTRSNGPSAATIRRILRCGEAGLLE